LCFIEETREYLLGKLRKRVTVPGKEAAQFIPYIKRHLPGCVQNVLLRADGEFLSWEAVKASLDTGFDFIIANYDKRADVENLVSEAKCEGLDMVP
jgi:hypothetical protein